MYLYLRERAPHNQCTFLILTYGMMLYINDKIYSQQNTYIEKMYVIYHERVGFFERSLKYFSHFQNILILLFPSIFNVGTCSILCFRKIFNFRCRTFSIHTREAMQFPFITHGNGAIYIYINDSIPTNTNVEENCNVYASERSERA